LPNAKSPNCATRSSQLPRSSVIIKEAAAVLDRLDEENFWITLNHQRLEFLRTEIKPLFRTVSEADFKAMRFERDILEYSLARLSEEKEKAETLKDGIVEQISELPLSVNFVKAEEELIRAAQPITTGPKRIAMRWKTPLTNLRPPRPVDEIPRAGPRPRPAVPRPER
jgi:hypothetical protein